MIQREEKEIIDRELAPTADTQEFSQFEQTLRPKAFFGIYLPTLPKTEFECFSRSFKKRKEPREHVLLHGSAGLGKTTLAYIIVNGMKASVKGTSGPAMERQGDLASVLTNLAKGDVLFIDEIHRLRPAVEEIFIFRDGRLRDRYNAGKGVPSARAVRLNLPRFTLIGATTKMSLLPPLFAIQISTHSF